MQVVIYSTIFGDVDRLIEPLIAPPCRMVCFSDRPRQSKAWEVIDWLDVSKMLPPDIPGHATALSRFFKMLPHRHFPDADYTIWIDGSDQLRGDPTRIIPFTEDMIQFQHPRRCVYRELDAIQALRKDSPETVKRLKQRYRAVGVPDNIGFAACSMIWRRNCQATNDFCERWWHEFLETDTRRDQPAWAVTQWRQPVNVRVLVGSDENNEFVRRRNHVRRMNP